MLGGLQQSGVTDATLAAHYAVQQDPVTGALEVNNVEIPGVATYTWADFTAGGFDLTVARFVHVTDKHSSNTGYGGSLWRVDPTGTTGKKRLLMSAPLYFALLSSAPDPTAYPGLLVDAGNVGICVSNGTRYRIREWQVDLLNTLTNTAHPTSPFTAEVILKSVQIPVDVNNKSIFDDGDVLQVVKAWMEKGGVAASMTRRYLMGSSVTVGDYTSAATGQVLTTTDAAGATLARQDVQFDLMRLSATTLIADEKVTTVTATFTSGGALSTAHNTATVTTTSFDSATPPSLHIASVASGSGDGAPTLRRGYRVRLIRGY